MRADGDQQQAAGRFGRRVTFRTIEIERHARAQAGRGKRGQTRSQRVIAATDALLLPQPPRPAVPSPMVGIMTWRTSH